MNSATSRIVSTPTEWRGDALQDRPEKWLIHLSVAEISEVRAAARRLIARGEPLTQAARADAPLGARMGEVRDRLQHGVGVVLLRGLPAREMSKAEAAAAYWLLGLHLGDAVSQNVTGDTLVDVRDTGASASDHNTRLYKTRAELTFHTDGADVIGLMCLRTAISGGVSRICSSVYVYNEVLRRRPDLADLMEHPFHHHAHDQFGANGPKTFQYPIVSRENGIFRMFLLLWYIRNAAKDFPDLAKLSPEQHALLDLLESIPAEPGVALDMQFQEGDIQFLKNSVILHARTEYEDYAEPEEKRHLLRLWLTARDFTDGDDMLREGVPTRHA